MKRIYQLPLLIALQMLLFVSQLRAQQYDVTSPSGLLQISLNVGSTIAYDVTYDGTQLISSSPIAISLNAGAIMLGVNATVSTTETRTVNGPIARLYGKSADLTESFNELQIDFTDNYSLIVRAYDEGVAYRFTTALGGDVIVDSETATFNLAGNPGVIFPEADLALQSWERSYSTYTSISDIAANRFAITPTLFSYPQTGIRVVVAEADLLDYPGMYVQRTATGMKGKWAQYPKTVSDPDDIYSYHRVLTRETFIAKTSGTREYPWRVVIVSTDDKDLLNNELIYKLATPSVLSNTSFIKPGKSAWEWWHDGILETTSIPSGPGNLNYNLYKYYVDFAAAHNLEYMTMDAGYDQSYLAQICQYAATQNVKIFVWDFINLPV
ncbi:MAG TPA: glycoside hydrolase family 97 N-terminal domain-containing protein, partial [Cyclobacteriaceae bacterium]|nr:glycoside hydrolase family 97 N-terminal domain-containing protein [Cyclobacteriaceae bacterium]